MFNGHAASTVAPRHVAPGPGASTLDGAHLKSPISDSGSSLGLREADGDAGVEFWADLFGAVLERLNHAVDDGSVDAAGSVRTRLVVQECAAALGQLRSTLVHEADRLRALRHLPVGARSPVDADARGNDDVAAPSPDRCAYAHAYFEAMFAAFQGSGGIARDDDLARWLGRPGGGESSRLSALIASGQVFGFDWHGTFWVPMFQFDRGSLSLKPGCGVVVAELKTVFDGWELARWFAQPNSSLDGRLPVDVVDSDLSAVLCAARIDRFVAAG